MAASVQCRPQDRSLGMVMKEVDEDLAIFLEMRRREKERNDHVLNQKSDVFDDLTASNPDSSVVSDIQPTVTIHTTPAADDLLNAENERSDYDWLLSPPGTPFFPSSTIGVDQAAENQTENLNAATIEPKLGPEKPPQEPSSLSETLAQPAASTSISSSASGNRRPSSSGGQKSKSTGSRFPTPTRRPGLPTASKPSRSSTPTARNTLPSSKPIAPQMRSSTPTRGTARSSTPNSRPSVSSTSKSTSRSTTPARKPSTPSSASSISAPCRSSSVNKAPPMTLKSPGMSHGTSPTIRSRPKKVSEIPVSSSDAPPNLRVGVPKRPSSASRGRPNCSSVQYSSTDTATGRPRQKSCSPLRGRHNATAANRSSTVLSRSRGYSNGSNDVNPVLMGTKMVERVVNMRKLAPPKRDDQPSNDNTTRKSTLSQDNASFGRSLSKKSLDMAIRHMDIRRSIPGNLNSFVKSVPASAVYSLRSGSTNTRSTSASDSPLATSSSASSEPSVNNSCLAFDGSDMEVNDIGSERESYSPTS